jgi:signal transduction histidine kinase
MIQKIKALEDSLKTESVLEKKIDLMNALSYEIRRLDRSRSLALCQETYTLSLPLEYQKGISESLMVMGTNDVYSGNYEEALKKCNEALVIMEKLSLDDSIVKVMNTKGYAYTRLGQGELGLEFFQKGLRLATTIGDSHMAVYFLSNIGDCYGLMNMHREALYWFFKAYKLAGSVKGEEDVKHELLDSLCMYISETYRKLGKLDDASLYAEKGITNAESTQDKVYEAHCYYVSGKVFRDKGEMEDALNRMIKSLGLYAEMNYRYNQGEVAAEIAEIYKGRGDIAEAQRILNEALEMAVEIKAPTLEKNIHKSLAEIYELKIDFQNALTHYKAYQRLSELITGEIQEKKLQAIVSVQKLEQAEKDAEIYRLRNIELKEASDSLMEKTINLEESRKNIEYISEIGRKITATQDIELIVNTIYENMNQLMDATIFGVALYDKRTDTLDYRVFIECGARIPRFVTEMDEEKSYGTKCVRAKKPIVCNSIENLGDEAQFLPLADIESAEQDPHSLVYIPLIIEEEVIGIYTVQSYKENAYSEGDVEMLVALSSFMAIALNNHLKSEELKMAATVLSETLENLKNTQAHLINSEKMAALGQLISGVAHEINTPLGAIQASINNISDYAKHTILEKLPALFHLLSLDEYRLFTEMLRQTTEKNESVSVKDERTIKKELIKQFKSFGLEDSYELADNMMDMGIFENIEKYKPLITSVNSHFIMQVCYEISGILRNTSNMKIAIGKASKMIYALKNYAHFDNSNIPIIENVVKGLETVLDLYLHNIKQGTTVVKRYGDIPNISCFPDELNQVWTNLIHNALQAMSYTGTLEIETRAEGQHVFIEITDSGTGIPEEYQSKVFDAFFTTKPQGEGSGLGLVISKQIIEKHKGELYFVSVPGKTTFTVKLPKG